MTPTTKLNWSELFAELQRVADGRPVDIHTNPTYPTRWARYSVYVRGDHRDGYADCVASSHCFTLTHALRSVLREAKKKLKQ